MLLIEQHVFYISFSYTQTIGMKNVFIVIQNYYFLLYSTPKNMSSKIGRIRM